MLAAGLLIAYSYDRHRATVEQSTLETARALMQAVDRELASGQVALRVLAASPYLASGDLAAFDRAAREILPVAPGNNFVLSDATGQQLVNTLRPFGEPLPRHGNPEQLRRVFQTGRPVISDLFVGGVLRRPVIALDVPVRRRGQVVYDLSLGMFPERLAEILAREKLPPGWVASIFDSNGTIVARTHDPARYVGHKGAPALVRRISELAEGRVETETLEGIPVVAVFSRSSVSQWSVAIGVPRSFLAKSLWLPVLWSIGGAVLLLAAGIALARSLGARIARSIRGLIAPAVALGRGEEVVVPPLELEEAGEVARALASASTLLREREEILAVVTHDLRSPLSAIMLGVSEAEHLAAGIPGTEAVRSLLSSLLSAGRRMSGMIEDLLALAVPGARERSMLSIAGAHASSLVSRAAEAVQPLFTQRGIELKVEVQDGLPDVAVDEDRVLRVFVNLLDNALKFTEPPGRVVLRAQAQPKAVRFSVSNSGPALSPAEREAMFRPFWQAKPRDRRGAGLGLSICHSVIETHGGRIWAEPEQGERVRVCFELPAQPTATP